MNNYLKNINNWRLLSVSQTKGSEQFLYEESAHN